MSAASGDWPPALSTAARLVTFAVVCGVLYWGQVVLVPLALAGFITFLLAPLVRRLDRLHVPRVAGVVIVLLGATAAVSGVGYLVVGQVSELAVELPAYRQNILDKLADLRGLMRGGAIENVQTTLSDIAAEAEAEAEAEAAAGATGAEARVQTDDTPAGADDEPASRTRSSARADDDAEPLQVEVVPERRLLGSAETWTPALETLATVGLAVLLAIFMLIWREDLRNRLVSLVGETSVVVTSKAFADAGSRISRYLIMQFIINVTMGIAVGVGLFFIGVPYAALWGLAAAVFRYVPYVGPWAAALLPILVSLVTAPGWEQVVLVVALFAVLELLSNNVMEPWLYGQSVGLSTIAVVISAIFWAWLWGGIGLVLATPMTVCLVVFARYIPELAVFDRLLSDRPTQQSHLWLYQRLLSRDEDEAEEIVQRHRAEHSLEQTCDELLLEVLLALKRDLAAARVTHEEGQFVASALSEIADDLPAITPEDEERPPREARGVVIGFPARDRIDAIALEILRLLLRQQHWDMVVLAPDTLIGERIAEVEAQRPSVVCIASLPPGDLTPLRHACKRLRARLPDVKLVVGRLGATAAPLRSADQLRAAGAWDVVATLTELRDAVTRLAGNGLQPVPKRELLAAAAASEEARLSEE